MPKLAWDPNSPKHTDTGLCVCVCFVLVFADRCCCYSDCWSLDVDIICFGLSFGVIRIRAPVHVLEYECGFEQILSFLIFGVVPSIVFFLWGHFGMPFVCTSAFLFSLCFC